MPYDYDSDDYQTEDERPFCDSCDSRVESTCDDCSLCHDCCQCEHSSIATRDLSLRIPYSDRINRPRHIGLEIEVSKGNSAQVYRDSSHLKHPPGIHEDGSLPDGGFEVVTHPESGANFESETQRIVQTLNDAACDVNASCGLHVHVSARNVDVYSLRKVLILYHYLEPTMYDLVAKRRWESEYAHPLPESLLTSTIRERKPRDWNHSLIKCLYHIDPRYSRDLKTKKYIPSRYTALNIHSLFYRGTLEFRLHESTLNLSVIVGWARLCESIVSTAMQNTETSISALYDVPLDNLLSRMTLHDRGKWVIDRLKYRHQHRQPFAASTRFDFRKIYESEGTSLSASA